MANDDAKIALKLEIRDRNQLFDDAIMDETKKKNTKLVLLVNVHDR